MATFVRSKAARIGANGNQHRHEFDQSYLRAPSGGLAPFIDNPAAAKRAGALPLAPPSRPRGFEDT